MWSRSFRIRPPVREPCSVGSRTFAMSPTHAYDRLPVRSDLCPWRISPLWLRPPRLSVAEGNLLSRRRLVRHWFPGDPRWAVPRVSSRVQASCDTATERRLGPLAKVGKSVEIFGGIGSTARRSTFMNDGWDRSASSWIAALGERGDWGREHVLDPIMLKRASAQRFERALDVGCGEGRFCRMLRAKGIPVVGIDPTEELLAAARKRDSRGEYQIARAESLPFPDASFDLVVSYLTLIDIADFRADLKEKIGRAHV